MSLHTVTLSFLSLKPRVTRTENRLVLESTFGYRLSYFFACAHKIEFDALTRRVSISRHSWWVKEHKDLFYFDLVEEVGFIGNEYVTIRGRDQYEQVWLAFKLKTRKEPVKLASFEGEGSRETGVWGVLFGDSIIDFRGDHVESAQEMKRLVEEILAKT